MNSVLKIEKSPSKPINIILTNKNSPIKPIKTLINKLPP